MIRQTTIFTVLVLSALLLQSSTSAGALPPAGTWIPRDTIFVLEVSNPKPILNLAFSPQVLTRIQQLPAYKRHSANVEFKQMQHLIGILEATFDTDWKTGLHALLGGGITLAVAPKDAAILIIDTKDPRMLQRLHEIFLNIARSEAQKQGKPERVVSAEYRGVTGWTFNGEEAHAILGNRLVIANSADTLKRVIDLRAEGPEESLAALPAYKTVKAGTAARPQAFAFVNLTVLRLLPGVGEALASHENPLATLLFADVMDALGEAKWIAMGLQANGDTLTLNAETMGRSDKPSKLTAFARPPGPKQGVLPNLTVPRSITSMSFYRDLHAFYAGKDELFPERTSGLIFFENMMGIFFSGRDLTEEVLGELDPEIRFVVAGQKYDPKVGTPKTQIPGFAAVLRMKNSSKFSEVAEEAWQKGLGLINFTRGQQALPGLILDRPRHGDTQFTLAYFSTSGIENKSDLDVRFNFRPSLAVQGDYLILSSTDSLTKDLIDVLKKEGSSPPRPLPGIDSAVEVDGRQLASVLQANREQMIRRNMVEKGNTREQAETEIGALITIVNHVDHARLMVGNRSGETKAQLKVRLHLQ